MSLKTKCILAPVEKDDGYRISVMSRHTLNDGVTPDERITKEMYDEHDILLSPSGKLLGDYYKRDLSWLDYTDRFKQEMEQEDFLEKLKNISQRALKENVTLLCIEEKPDFCHRRLLAEECRKYQPDLEIIIH